jgi:hypothetical protein
VGNTSWVLLEQQQGRMGPLIGSALGQLLLLLLLLLLLVELATQQHQQTVQMVGTLTFTKGSWQDRVQILWTLCVL